MKKIILFGLALLLLIGIANADIYVGVVDGYVLNLTGNTMSGVSVTATIQECSAGCTGTDTTDSNGYYVINNLNIAENDTINVNASSGNYYGNNTGTADQFYTATINITVAQVPNSPTLTPINDTHNNSLITFSWINYSDPQGLATYNDWIFDGTTYHNVSSPQNKTNVDFELYTWYVKTCNAYGCSPLSSDTFNVSNLPPPKPSLTPINDTNQNNITFTWASDGADPDGDDTYFKFNIDGNITSYATSPKTLTLSNGSHTWKVQECDPYECSLWTTDTFSITNNAPSTPNLTQMNSTSATSKQFHWTSGTDPEGDTTYDEFQFNNNTIVSPATSGITQALSGTFYYTWKVRTCDVYGACSAWSKDSFVKFTCPSVASPTTPGGGGGAGRPGGVITPKKINCTENWHCTSWTPCSPKGIQHRACNDWNKCGTNIYRPIESRACTPAHCFNNKKDHTEERTDCGGLCKPCEALYLKKEIAHPYFLFGIKGIDIIYLILGLVIGIFIVILTIMVTMKYSDHFNLYIRLRLVHWQISLGSKKHAFADYYEKVLPHYKRLKKELIDEWLDNEIKRLNTSAKRRLSKLKIKRK
ncbi:hypothetical protein GF358_01950 [Candidatus Woesearchaeota archaeon]|nr:hypothetical protein [Candidatus Woesearchaeota archaeon]